MRRFGFGGASFAAILSGALSFPQAGLPNFFDRAIVPEIQQHRAKRKAQKRRPGGTRRGWRPIFYGNAGPASREAERRRRQGAHFQQLWSHKPGTVQPRHIFKEIA